MSERVVGLKNSTNVCIGHFCGGLVFKPAAHILLCRSINKHGDIHGCVPFRLHVGMWVVPAACNRTCSILTGGHSVATLAPLLATFRPAQQPPARGLAALPCKEQ